MVRHHFYRLTLLHSFRPSEVLVFAGKTAELHLESQTSVAVLYKVMLWLQYINLCKFIGQYYVVP